MPQDEPIIRLHEVTKDYRGLRPLRVRQLEIHQGQAIALLGFDQVMAEVLVDLITGATLPDGGEISVLGQATRTITDADRWLSALDQFGLLSDRAVLVAQFTAEQNLLMPLTLSLESVPDALRDRVRHLGSEVGLSADQLATAVGRLDPTAHARVRLGRALALDPRVLLAEHPSATLSATEAPAFATNLRHSIRQRQLTALVLTADVSFARAIADQVMTLQPATGALKPSPPWRRWFS